MSMSVQDMIEMLEQMDPIAIVIISRDPEGNNYAPVEACGQGFFDTKFSEYHEEEEPYDFEPDDDSTDDDYKKPKGAVPAVVLWPSY